MDRFNGIIDEIDLLLKQEISTISPDKLRESMEYSVFAGGKRLRGLFLIATYHLFHDMYLPALPFASAIEAIHTYSLIHDDLPAMDDDDIRRGKASNHIAYDEATAILAGDALLNIAFEIILKSVAVGDGREVIAASYLARQSGGNNGMISGQVRDIDGENKEISLEELFIIYEEKTGALWQAVFVIGSLLAGVSEEIVLKLERVGKLLGFIYQIQDDILEATKTEDELGKSISDNRNKKQTAVSILGLNEAKKKCRDLWKEIYDLLDSMNIDFEDTLFLELLEKTKNRDI